MADIPMSRVTNRMTGRRVGSEWYECEGCGFNYPRSEVRVQNGRIRCLRNCTDTTGRDILSRDYPLRTEEDVPPLPDDPEEV